MMSTCGGEESAHAVDEHGRDDRHVRQMRAAVVRRIAREHITVADIAFMLCDDRGDAIAHRSKMYRHVRRIGDEIAVGIEDRAGEIEPFLDVHRGCRVLQRGTHFMKRFANTSKSTGSTSLVDVRLVLIASTRESVTARSPVISARQPGSTTIV